MSGGLGVSPSTSPLRGVSGRGLAAPWRGFARVGGARVLARWPRALAAAVSGLALVCREALGPAQASGAAAAGRAQRGLDLFLGQNRTEEGGKL